MSKRMVDLQVNDGKITSIDGYEAGGGTAVEANPQEEATQQLQKIKIDNIAYNIAGEGGGTYKVEATRSSSDYNGEGNNYDQKWSGEGVQPNTAYEVGRNFDITFTTDFKDVRVNSNEILVASDVHQNISKANYTLTYGDVVLALTSTKTTMVVGQYVGTTTYRVRAYNYLTYTVIKAGTTGANTAVPASGWESQYTRTIYSFNVTKAQA